MKIVYVKLNDENKVVRVDTNKIIGYIRVKVEDDMTGDKLLSCFYVDNELKFDEQYYNNRIKQRKTQARLALQRKNDETKLKSIEMKYRLASLTDDEAVGVMSLFPIWDKDNSYLKGDRIVYSNQLYNVLDNTGRDNGEPDKTPNLYSVI